MRRTFKREFSCFDEEAGARRRFPAGWSGDVSDDIAKQADDAGVTVNGSRKTAVDDGTDDLGRMNKEALLAHAAALSIEVDPAKTKAEIIGAIRAAIAEADEA